MVMSILSTTTNNDLTSTQQQYNGELVIILMLQFEFSSKTSEDTGRRRPYGVARILNVARLGACNRHISRGLLASSR